MTATNMDLRELLEQTADTDFLREMIGFTAQRLMELEVETLTGAAHSSRSADRLTHRNGYSFARVGHTRGHGAFANPENPQGQLLPRFPRAAADGREGADRGHPGGLHPGCFHLVRRQSGAGDGDEWHLEKPGQPPVQRDRRAGEHLPQPSAGGRVALSLARTPRTSKSARPGASSRSR
jgi:hypothetical protein